MTKSRDAVIIGNNIRRRRRQLGLTQVELAERVDKHRAHVGYWETARHKPQQRHLAMLAQALEVTEDWLQADHDH
jgi:transcriptional regulator with XRE-family HTH domain